MMKVANEVLTVIPNRAMELANLYHQQSLAWVNLALSHNKITLESSHQRALELLEVRDPKPVHELVSSHMINQVKDSLNFAVASYQMGFESHTQVAKVIEHQKDDICALANEILKSRALEGNPISAMALSAVKSTMDTGQAVINGANAMTKKTSELATSSLSNSKSQSRAARVLHGFHHMRCQFTNSKQVELIR